VNQSQDLRSFLAFDTGAFPLDGANRVGEIENIWGVPIYIRQTHVWMGAGIGARGDFWMKLYRTSDGSVLEFTNWDHYGDPNCLSNMVKNFEPNYMLMAVGDKLHLDYGGYAPGFNGQVVVRVWWTANP
jgi:hypothetical protein